MIVVDELERIRNKWLQHSVKYYFSIFPDGLEKTTESLARIQPVVSMPKLDPR
jgi:hypothetical protein